MSLALHRERRIVMPSGINIGAIGSRLDSSPGVILGTPSPGSIPPTGPDGAVVVWAPSPIPGSTDLHWSDIAAAQAWIVDAARRSTDAVAATIDAMTTEAEQEQAVLQQWTSLGNVFRCLNIPPTICPSYRGVYLAWIGQAYTPGTPLESQIDTALAQRIGALYADPMPLVATMAQRAIALANPPPPFQIKAPLRVNLAQDATVVSQCMGGDATTWNALCNAAEAGAGGTTTYYPAITTPGQVPWGTMRANFALDPAGYGNNFLRIAPPARWFFDMGAELARELAALGAATVLAQSLANQVLLNFKTANDLGLVPAALAAQAASLPHDFENLRWHNAQRATIDTFLQTAATIAHLVPGYGTLVAGIIMGFKAIVDALPSAVGLAARDPWGRATPLVELSFISQAGLHGMPNYSLNGPPGFVQPPHVTAQTSAPMSKGTKIALAVAGVGALGYAADALDLIDLGKLFRKK